MWRCSTGAETTITTDTQTAAPVVEEKEPVTETVTGQLLFQLKCFHGKILLKI